MQSGNKYNEIIKNLILCNKKYRPELESILEDIVDDVMKHAKSMIENVSDESVLINYLTKMVTTSIITISRRANLNSRTSVQISALKNTGLKAIEKDSFQLKAEAVSELVEPISSSLSEEDSLLSDSDDNYDTELNLDDAESIENISEEFVAEEETVLEPPTEQIIEEISEEVVTLVEDKQDVELDNLETEAEQSEQNWWEKVPEVQVDNDVDKTLVEKMINGVKGEEPLSEVISQEMAEQESDTSSSEVYDVLDDIEIEEEKIQDSNLEEVVTTDTESETFDLVSDSYEEENLEEEVISDAESETFDLVSDNYEEENLEEEVISDTEPETFDLVSDSYEEENLEEVVTTDAEPETFDLVSGSYEEENLEPLTEREDFSLQMADDFILEEDESENSELLETETVSLNLVNSDFSIENNLSDESDVITNFSLNQDYDNLKTVEETSNETSLLTSYDCFSYEPAIENIDNDIINSAVNNLARNTQDIDVFELIELKFKQDKSVSEISETLGIDKSVITRTLGQVVEIVKE